MLAWTVAKTAREIVYSNFQPDDRNSTAIEVHPAQPGAGSTGVVTNESLSRSGRARNRATGKMMVMARRISAGVDVSKSTVTQIICSAQTIIPIFLQALVGYLVAEAGRGRWSLLRLGLPSAQLPHFFSARDQISVSSFIPFVIKFFQRAQNHSFRFPTIDASPVCRAALSPVHHSSVSKPACRLYERRWC